MDDVYLKLGISQLQEKKFNEALEFFQKALNFNEQNKTIYYYIGNCYYLQDNLNEALPNYEIAIEFNIKLEDSYRKKGMILKKNGLNEKAFQMFNKVLEINPKNYYAYYMKGKINYDLRKFNEAIKDYEKAIELNKDKTFKEGKEGIILSYAGLNERTNAFNAFKSSYSGQLKEPEVLAFKARLHKEFGEYFSAIDAISSALVLKPNEAIFLGDKIVYLYYLNKFEECANEGTMIIEKRRKLPSGLKGFQSLLFYVGCSYSRLQKPNEAQKLFDEYEAEVKEANWKEEYLIEKSRIQLEQNPKNALKYIEMALKANPKSIKALKFKLGYYELFEDKFTKESIEALRNEVSSLDVKKPEVYDVVFNQITDSYLINSVVMNNTQSQEYNNSSVNQNLDIKDKLSESSQIDSNSISSSITNLNLETSENCDFKVIGKGAFGNVYLVKMYNGEDVAMKRFNNIVIDQKEREILQSINHPNIVRYLGFFHDDIHLELCNGGDLFTQLIILGVHLPKKFKYKIIHQIASALRYLHNDKKIIHGDIKNQNILLDKPFEVWQKEVDEFPNAKLCDFGLSKIVSDKEKSKTGGSLAYASPEAITGGELTIESDIYSFGMTMFELFKEEIPYQGMDRNSVENSIKRGITPKFEFIESCPKELIEVMKSCCKRKPKERETIENILNNIIAIKSLDY